MAIQSDSKKYLYGNGSARLPSAGGCCWLSYLSDLKFGISGHNYSLISPLLPGTYLIIYIGTKLVWKCNISLTTQVKILPQMIVFAAHKKYDYQIKCHPGCCIFNTHSCLLILPPTSIFLIRAPLPLPQKLKQTNTQTILGFISSSLQFQSHPPYFFFRRCLWSELYSRPAAISALHWRSLNEGRHISPEDWVSVSPRLLSSLTHCLNT